MNDSDKREAIRSVRSIRYNGIVGAVFGGLFLMIGMVILVAIGSAPVAWEPAIETIQWMAIFIVAIGGGLLILALSDISESARLDRLLNVRVEEPERVSPIKDEQ